MTLKVCVFFLSLWPKLHFTIILNISGGGDLLHRFVRGKIHGKFAHQWNRRYVFLFPDKQNRSLNGWSSFWVWRCRSYSPVVIEDPDSHEEAISRDSDKTALKRRADNTHDRLVGPVEPVDLSRQVDNSSVEQVNQRASVVADDHRREATRGGGAGLNGRLAAGRSREQQDLESLEDGAGRPAPVRDHRRDPDYDGKSLPLIHQRSIHMLKALTADSNVSLRNQRSAQLWNISIR